MIVQLSFLFQCTKFVSICKGVEIEYISLFEPQNLLGRLQNCFPRSPTLAGTAEQNGYTITGTKEVRNIRKCI